MATTNAELIDQWVYDPRVDGPFVPIAPMLGMVGTSRGLTRPIHTPPQIALYCDVGNAYRMVFSCPNGVEAVAALLNEAYTARYDWLMKLDRRIIEKIVDSAIAAYGSATLRAAWLAQHEER